MKVIFYLHATGLCGGIRVVCEYVSRLNDAGVDCELWTPPVPKINWYSRPLRHRQFSSLDEMGKIARATRAHKVATWWETAYWVAETCRDTDKGFYLTQDIETTYSQNSVQSGRILQTYQLGLTPLPTSRWVERQLKEVVKSSVEPRFVGLGIDLDIYSQLPMMREKYRIFTPYRPHAGPNDLKGWLCGRVAADVCRKIEPNTSLVTFNLWNGPNDVPEGMPHIHIQGANDQKMREMYSQAGVFLSPSNHEGFNLTALEAMACGCPVVTTRCNGNEEYIEDGVNCLAASPGEAQRLGEHCAAIMADNALASRLSYAGLSTADKYRWEYAVKRMKTALSG